MTKQIALGGKRGKGKHVIVDASTFNWLNSFSWSLTATGYAEARCYGKNVHMHRLITSAPKGKQVDHVNGDKLDNRECNLRLCSASQNLCNKGKPASAATHPYKGVCYVPQLNKRNPWMAYISSARLRKHIGYFASAQLAAEAYDSEAIRLHGVFASLNFKRDTAHV
jgi:hypothetical protein